jgi:hypothetical protein
MAKNKTPITDVAVSSDTISVTLTQQALNLLRQIVSNQGWATTILDIYTGGKLLAETLPQLDPVDWAKSDEDIRAMKPKEREAYVARDREWTSKQVPVTVTPVERDAIERAFQHFAKTAASAKQLGPNVYLLELIVGFQIKDKVEEDVPVPPKVESGRQVAG